MSIPEFGARAAGRKGAQKRHGYLRQKTRSATYRYRRYQSVDLPKQASVRSLGFPNERDIRVYYVNALA